LSPQTATLNPDTIDLPYIHHLVWDATRSRIIANAGSNILVINREPAQIEDTIASGVSRERMAISDNGQYLYIAIGSRAVVDRYQIRSHVGPRNPPRYRQPGP
jgi:hypothetical protein